MDFTNSKLHNVLVTSDLHYLKSSVSYVSSDGSRIFQGRTGDLERVRSHFYNNDVFFVTFVLSCVNRNIGNHATHFLQHKNSF